MARLTVLGVVVLVLAVLSATSGLGLASVITIGDVDPGGAATQPDPWTVGDELKVGNFSNGTLNVDAGSMVSNTKGYIGYESGSTGEATVTGSGSKWNNSNNFYVGYEGIGTLNVAAGGVVSNHHGYLGHLSESTGEVTVTGSGSQWNNSGVLNVARYGDGILTVEAGGVVSNTYDGYIGRFTGSTGEAAVTGSGSQWNNSSNLLVGFDGSGTLTVTDGGVVSNTYGYIGLNSGSTGIATVTGTGSQWNNLDTLVGMLGDGTMNVEAGGMVSNTDGYIGRDSGSTSEATVTGSGSQWTNSNSLYIGGDSSQAGGSGTLNLNDSGLVTVSGTTKIWSTGTINLDGGSLATGSFDNSEAGTLNFHDGMLTVNGASGVFSPGTNDFTIDGNTVTDLPELVITNTASATLSGFLGIGSSKQGKLTVEAGGVVSNTEGYIGYQSGSTGEATVTGSGSQWENSGDLVVGYYGLGSLNIAAEGDVSSQIGFIGGYSTGSGVATVTGTNALWENSMFLYVGYHGDGQLNVTNGGMVASMGGYISRFTGSLSVATISGTDSIWDPTTSIHVAYKGNGSLIIEDGGTVTNENGYISNYDTAVGTVTVTGNDSLWDNSQNLVVGNEGTATLNIENGGQVIVGGTTSIGPAGSINLTGGRFEFGQMSLSEFSTIQATGGAMAGNVPLTGVHDVALLTALQNSTADLNDVVADNSGLLHGSATLTSSLHNRADGEVRLLPGNWVRIEGTGNLNSGEINNFGGQVDFAQDMTNESGGFIGGRGQFVADGGWTNQGVMAFSGTTDILGDINIKAGGKIITSGGATTTIFDDLVNNGVVKVSDNSAVVYFGSVSGSGSFTGSGTAFLEGDLSPGSSPGAMSFGGDVVLGESSTTLIELAGTANGQYDRLLVAGELEVSGALEVELLDGFVPTNETAFEILAATDLSGEFSSLVLPDLLGNLSWDSSLLYSNGTLSVIPEPATLSLLAIGMLMACRWRRRGG